MFSLDGVAGEMSRSNSGGSGNFAAANPITPLNPKQFESDLLKSREFMASDLFQQSPGLARYRSAPSSFLAALLDSPADNSSSGDESEALFSAIWNGPRDLNQKGSDDSQMQFHNKPETGAESEVRPGGNAFSTGLARYESAVACGGGGAIVGSYSMGLESHVQVRLNSGSGISGSNLVKQRSSPAGFFTGFGVVEDVGSYRDHRTNSTSSGGSSSHLNFPSGPSSSPRIMPSIPENGGISACESRSGNVRELDNPSFSHETWSESLFNDMKRDRDGSLKMFSTFSDLHNQDGDAVKSPASLVHHLSLPKASIEKGEAEKFKFLQFQPDVVPCQIRAKRGCATHPRSIAERMRRTRISEKMKKLQELFPNMDKQTSTADMLDLAVGYIKDLQKQLQTLTEANSKCVCSSKPQGK